MVNVSKRVESAINACVPFFIVALLLMLVVELAFSEMSHTVHSFFFWLEWGLIIPILYVELAIHYSHCKDARQFFRKYWLHILAVLPIAPLIKCFSYFGALERLGALEGLATAEGALKLEEVGSKLARTERVAEGLLKAEEVGSRAVAAERVAEAVVGAEGLARAQTLVRAERVVRVGEQIPRVQTITHGGILVSDNKRVAFRRKYSRNA